MSTRTALSAWSPEEVDSLENIDKEVQLVSTSSESNSVAVSNVAEENGSVNNGKSKSDSKVGQTHKNVINLNSNLSKLHSSCDDLSLWTKDNKLEFLVENDSKINRSSTFVNIKQNKKIITNKYEHVESKIKHYFNNSKEKLDVPVPKQNLVVPEIKESSDKEDYLEQINRQLAKELDEKNAILSLLQENYERLLFKYAEAQNRIDELRFKVMAETPDSKSSSFQAKHNRLDNQISLLFPYSNDYSGKVPDIKCQKAVVAPFMKCEEPVDEVPSVNRPSSLPLDNNLKPSEKDYLKAATPTDSEGLSSIITSMSGHSKILNSLDEETHINKKSNYLKYQTNNFILEETPTVNDPFDKVKNWQNSLPPLEQIETPDTTLYNVFSNNADGRSSSGTKYKEISPKKEKVYMFSDESCPDSWREERQVDFCINDAEKSKSQKASKMSSEALSLPNTLSKRNATPKKAHRSLDVFFAESSRCQNNALKQNVPPQPSQNDVPSTCIIQRRQKRPSLLRCSSLPAYDQDSVRSGNCRNGIYIPPLDLNNVTLSDDESYCQQEYYNSKNNAVTSSYVTSRGGSIDRSIQTPQSFSSCKATISEENSYPRVPKQTVNKSTSITPERSRAMDLFLASKYDASRIKTPSSNCIKECRECCSDKPSNWCNVCGESISDNRTLDFYKNRSNSCESVHNSESSRKESGRRPKPPFKRSVSFGSESLTPKFCSQEESPRNFFSGLSQESLENFDIYASSLKARSQVVIKALTAHVNNCTQ